MIRTAILGAGIGAQHLAAFRTLPDLFDIALIVDADTSRAATLADGLPTAPDIQTALDDPSIDLIDICLPPHLHVPVALQAMAAGKHVICEKPIATSLADIDRLRTAQTETGMSLFPVFQYRFGPAFAALAALRDAGLTGKPLIGSLETHWARGPEYYAIPWRGTWAGEQGGAVLGHAIHAHDLMSCHLGPVSALSAALATSANQIETEDCAAITFTLTTGALVTSSITLGAARDETRLRFVFDRLTATSGTDPYAPGTGAWSFIARDPSDQAAIDAAVAGTPDAPSGFAGAFTEIAKALRGAPNAAVSFNDGAASIELVTAIYAAARTGTRVTLPLPKDHPMHHGWQP